MNKSLFDKYTIKETIEEDGSVNVYIVEEIETKKKYFLKKYSGNTTGPAYETVAKTFGDIYEKAPEVSSFKTNIVEFFIEDGNSYILMDYKDEKSLKEVKRYLSIGKILNNRYLVIKGIAGGGFGTVYLVRDLNLPDKYWALKEMQQTEYGDNEIFKRSFKVEAEMLSRLDHPSIPRISDFFIEDNKLYLIMDYVKGETLKSKIKKIKKSELFSEDLAIKWAIDICNVLEYLHTREEPVVFRDLKPDNIMIADTGDLKLIDFGISRVFMGSKSATTKYALLTEGYAPQEQWLGKAEPRSDIYALGATLFYILSGIHPKEVAPEFPLLRKYYSSLSHVLEKIVAKAVEPKMSDRYQTVASLKEDLQNIFREKEEKKNSLEHIQKGKEYEEKEDFYNANFEYMTALKYDCKNYHALLGSAKSCEKLGFYDKAGEHYASCLTLTEMPEGLKEEIRRKVDELKEKNEKTIGKRLDEPEKTGIQLSEEEKADEKTLPVSRVKNEKTTDGPNGKNILIIETPEKEEPQYSTIYSTELYGSVPEKKEEKKKNLLVPVLIAAGIIIIAFLSFIFKGYLPSVLKNNSDNSTAGPTDTSGNTNQEQTGEEIDTEEEPDTGEENSSGGEDEEWKKVLLDNLKKEPGMIYCAAGDKTHEVACIKGETHKNDFQWPLEDNIVNITLKPDGTELWCVSTIYSAAGGMNFELKEQPIIIINPETGKVIDKVDCPYVSGIAFTPDGKKVYICLYRENKIAVYDVKTRKETGFIEVGKHPASICISFDGKRAYVGHGPCPLDEKVTEMGGHKLPVPMLKKIGRASCRERV